MPHKRVAPSPSQAKRFKDEKERYTRPLREGTQFKRAGSYEIPRPFGGDTLAKHEDMDKFFNPFVGGESYRSSAKREDMDEFFNVMPILHPKDEVSDPALLKKGSRTHDPFSTGVAPRKAFGTVDQTWTLPPTGNIGDAHGEAKKKRAVDSQPFQLKRSTKR